MSEIAGPFSAFEADMGHDFGPLRQRIVDGLQGLHTMAHLDGSPHNDTEILHVETDIENVPHYVDFKKSTRGALVVVIKNSESIGGFLYYCDITRESRGPSHAPGKHASTSVEKGAVEAKKSPPLTQIDKMVIIASMLEGYNRDVENQAAKVTTYGSTK